MLRSPRPAWCARPGRTSPSLWKTSSFARTCNTTSRCSPPTRCWYRRNSTPSSSGSRMEHEPSLRDHIDLLLGRWWLVAAVAAVALTTALVSSLTTPRVYRAATTVLVDRTGASLRLASDSTGISQQVFVDSY